MNSVNSASVGLALQLVGVLQLLFFLQMLPHLRRAFLSVAYGGYGDDRLVTRILQSPPLLVIGSAAWVGGSVLLISDRLPLLGALLQLVIAQYVFIRVRWTSLSRGCGAPGYCSYWLSLAASLLCVGSLLSPAALQWLSLAITIDFALIFLVAGLYKVASGYASGFGVLLGLANPEWGYAPNFWQRRRPKAAYFKVLDTYGWLGEIVGALLILVPATRAIGAVVIAAMFLALVPLVRLGTLTLVVIGQCLLVILLAGDPLSLALKALLGVANVSGDAPVAEVHGLLVAGVLVYLGFIILGYTLMLANFFASKRLPGGIQSIGEISSNALGQILWRVFTADVTDFYVNIFASSVRDSGKQLISRWSGIGWGRYQDVTEAITVTSIFTTRRYFPGDHPRFTDRLMRYAQTLGNAHGDIYIFELTHLDFAADHVRCTTAVRFIVDRTSGSIKREQLESSDPTAAPSVHTRSRPGSRPGSYLPSQPPGSPSTGSSSVSS